MAGRAARVALALLLAASLALSLWSGAQLARGWPASAFLDAGADRIAARLEAGLARAAANGQTLTRFAALLDDTPRNWRAIDAIEAELARQGIALPPDLAARRQALHAADHGALATARACTACAWDARTCTLESATCALPVYLTPVPDLAGVLREGGNYLTGAEVDEIDLALSAIGLSAFALVPVTGGTSLAVKTGAALGRIAKAMGRLPPALARSFRTAAREGFDWAGLPAVRSLDDFAALTRPTHLRPAVVVLNDGGRIAAALGVAPTLHMLAHAGNATDLRRLANVAEAAPARSVAALEVLGSSRLLRTARRVSDIAYAFLSAAAVFLSTLAGLVGNALTWALRRAARAGARR